jgi:FdhE protein
MIEDAVRGLEELARSDPTVALLALLQAESLRACADDVWEVSVPELSATRLSLGLPLLHDCSSQVDPDGVRRRLTRLADVAVHAGHEAAGPLRAGISAGRVDPLAVMESSITQDAGSLAAAAAASGADQGLLATLAHLAALPLLMACGRRAAPLLEAEGWEAGYCPVCAAWPLLAELRGLERERWLRCGRCGAGWVVADQECVFCGNRDFNSLGYLAPEADRESRRAVTCDRCQSFLKTQTVLTPVPPAELGIRDLTTLELDIAAIGAGYGRPEAAGFPLSFRLEPAAKRAARLGWRR